MAYERLSDNPVKGESLEAFVANLGTLYKRQLSIRNVEDETRFNTMVLEDDMSLEDQLAYRQDQLKRVSDDPDERRRVRGEISNLKQRIVENDFTDAYSQKLTDFQAGLISIDNVISFLNDQRANTTDSDVLDVIDKNLQDAAKTKFQLTQDLIKNTTEYANTSKNVSLIDSQIAKVSSYRTQAALAGNDQLVSVYDLQLQSLNSSKVNAQVQNDVLGLGAISATGQYSAIALLDAFNQKISTSASTGPVRIGDTTYASAKDFWTFKRDSYLSDQGANGFFPALTGELKDNNANLYSKNSLTVDAAKQNANTFTTLAARPELANYQRQLDLYKQDVSQDAANKIVSSVTNQFARDLDVNKAATAISAVKALGVNVDDAFTKILQSNAATKSTQVSNILAAAQVAMQNDPNLTPEAAIAQAVSAGAGTVVSPEQAANQSERQLATDITKTAAAGQGVNDPRTTVAAPTEPANTPNASGNLNASSLVGLPNLTPGMRSEDVKTLQNYLIQQGFQIPDGATGFYGPQTTAAVAEFQKKNNIDAAGNPGYFGPRTKNFLSGSQTTTTPAPAPAPIVNQPQPQVQQQQPAPQQQSQTQPQSGGYTFNKLPNGNVEVLQNGTRIGTGTSAFAKGYGYTGS